MTKPTHAYIILTEDGIDQICESKETALAATKELREMGFAPHITQVSWDRQDQYVDDYTRRFPLR